MQNLRNCGTKQRREKGMSTKAGKLLIAVALPLLIVTSCATDEGGPKRGTAGWYLAEAETAYDQGDMDKMLKSLEVIADADSDLKQRATLWMIAIHAGLARGYMELGNAYADGIKELEDPDVELLNALQQHRRDGRRYAIAFAEQAGPLLKMIAEAESVPLDFPFPEGKAEASDALKNLSKGDVPNPAQMTTATEYTMQRGLVLQATELAGVGEDAAKAKTMFGTRPVQVPKNQFVFGLGKSLWHLSDLFGRDQLNERNVQGVMVNTALQCLEPALESEDEEVKKQAEEIKKEIDEVKESRQI